ncbi:MAG: hypothetical protein ACI9OJ_002932 [Myxococcota bacterium]|jgi:hypothetical protein
MSTVREQGGALKAYKRLLIAMSLPLALIACSETLAGPTPELDPPSTSVETLPVAPGVLCRDQHTTEVRLSGDGFSPVPIDVPDNPSALLPTVTLGRVLTLTGTSTADEIVTWAGEVNHSNATRLSWQSLTQMTVTVRPSCTVTADCPTGLSCHAAGVCVTDVDSDVAGPLAEGLYDVTITNGNGNATTSPQALAVIGRPTLADVSPGIVCLAEGPRPITLGGTRMLSIDSDEPAFQIEGRDGTLRADAATLIACTDVSHAGFDVLRYCGFATITLAQDSVPVGYSPIRVDNPAPAGCHSTDDVRLRVVPPPTITAIAEIGESQDATVAGDGTLVCLAEGPRQVVIHGADLLEIDGILPSVTVAGANVMAVAVDGCEPLETMGHTVRRCTRLTIELPESLAATDAPYQPEVVVLNPMPAGCSANTEAQPELLTIVPPPTVDSVVPPVVCLAEGPRTVAIEGTDFLTVDGDVPSVFFANDVTPLGVKAAECSPLSVGGKVVQRCTRLEVEIAANALAAGQHGISVTNPMPAGCSSAMENALTVVPGPSVNSADPALVCVDDGVRVVEIRGTGFITVDGALPEVTMDGVPVLVDAATGCAPVPTAALDVTTCTGLTVTVAQNALSPANTVIRVTNPNPPGCSVTNDTALTVPPAMVLTSATPNGACAGVGGTLGVRVEGDGFLVVGGDSFSVTVSGAPATLTATDGCTSLDVDGLDVQSCTAFELDLDLSGKSAGPIAIAVTSPPPSGCAVAHESLFVLAPPPTVTGAVPDELCGDTAGTAVALVGQDFSPNASAWLTDADGMVHQPDALVFVSASELQLTYSDGLTPGAYSATVSNGVQCDHSASDVLVVHPTPLTFFVDPPVVYNGITTEVTIYTSGLAGLAAAITLIGSGGDTVVLDDFKLQAPLKPNRISADVPSGLVAGDYEVSVTSEYGCVSSLNGHLSITDSLTLDLAGVDPSFASPSRDTAVTVTALDTGPTFEPVPRVYLNPTSDSAAIATNVRATVLEGPRTLNGVVPAGLVPGSYDLIVVNPTGDVGLLTAAVTVTADEPPAIESVAPASLDANTEDQSIRVVGQHLDTGAGATVSLECRDFETGMPVAPSPIVTTSAGSATEVLADVNTSGVPAGAVCEVVLTRTDGASYRFSALSLKEPSQNLNPWSSGPAMGTARRAPALVAGRPTDRSRFLYAVGGDSGEEAQAHTSVEAAPVGVYGTMGAWVEQRNDLSNVNDGGLSSAHPRTFAEGVTIGEFIYLTGGHDGVSSVASVLRTRILKPRDAPDITDLDASPGNGVDGMTGGIWYYRVTAKFPTDDPFNPGGESLPGEVFTVQLPDIASKIVLSLQWDPVDGASGYTVYRTPAADDIVTNVAAIASTTSPQYTDIGATADPLATPMPQGALGVWHVVASMATARSAHATVAVNNPADPNVTWLYAFGGRDANGLPVSSGEWATVTRSADGGQTISPFAPLGASLNTGRAELGGFVVTAQDSLLLSSGSTLVYLGQGRTATGLTSEFEVGVVQADGDIPSLSDIGGPTPTRAGSTDLQANGWLFILGGSNGKASNGNDTSGEVTSAAGSIDNWDGLGGGSMVEARRFMGATSESAFFFIAGGSNATALSTTELTIQ